VTTEHGYALQKGADKPLEIKNGANYIPTSFSWKLLAARENELGGADVYLKNKSSDKYAMWYVDDKGLIKEAKILSKSDALDVEEVLQVDINDDGRLGKSFTEDSLASRGTITIGTTDLGLALLKPEGKALEIKLGKDYIPSNFGWKVLAAKDDENGGYEMYLKNKDADQYVKWHLDGNGVIQEAKVLPKSKIFDDEDNSGLDINGDGHSGRTFTDDPKASKGNVGVGFTELGLALKNADSKAFEIKLGSEFISSSFGWKVQVATDDGADGYVVYLKNKAAEQYVKWHVGNNGEIKKGDLLSKAQILDKEDSSGLDINEDGRSGRIFTDDPKASKGNVGVGFTDLGLALKNADGKAFEIKLGSEYISSSFGWKVLAATNDDDGYDVYLKNKTAEQYVKWRVDSNGLIKKGGVISKAEILDSEDNSGLDINEDGHNGRIFREDSEASKGTVGVGFTDLGLGLKKADGKAFEIKLGTEYIPATFGWKVLAAKDDGEGGSDVYLKNKVAEQFVKWRVDDKGVILNGRLLTKADIFDDEDSSGLDINDDGRFGRTFTDDESASIGNVGVGSTELGLALKNADGKAIEIKLGADYIPSTFGWKVLAATDDGVDGYDVFLKNKTADQYVRWNIDFSGNVRKGEILSKAQVLENEERSGLDFNDDGRSGLVFKVDDSVSKGNIVVGSTELGLAFKNVDDKAIVVKLGTGYIPETFGWKVLAVTDDRDGGYDLFLKNKVADQYVKWYVDDRGSIKKGDVLSKALILENEEVSGLDIDDDGRTGLTFKLDDLASKGNVPVGLTELGLALKNAEDKAIVLKLGSGYIPESFGWKVLAATDDGAGAYDVYLKNKSAEQYVKWHVEDNGRITKGDILSKAQILDDEETTGLDINDDGNSGRSFAADEIASKGGIVVGSTELGLALLNADGKAVEIKLGAAYIPSTFAWKVLAAVDDGAGAYDLYLKNKLAEQFVKWHVDDRGVINKGDFMSKAQLLDDEISRELDIDGDGHNGRTFTDDPNGFVGSVRLGTTEFGLALLTADEKPLEIKLAGNTIPSTFGWKLTAAIEDGAAGYDIYLKNKSAEQWVKWHVNDKGFIDKGEVLTNDRLLEAEQALGTDLSGDGVTLDEMGMIQSFVTYTLDSKFDHLMLSGDKNIDGTGNDLDNVIEGNSGRNVLDGKGGSNMLLGHEAADTFVFSTAKPFGAAVADHIIDFNSDEGDALQIRRGLFGLDKNAKPTLTTVNGETELIASLKTDVMFVYSSNTGDLYWNQNGRAVGFGTGGIFAVLDNQAQLNVADISLV
jgi:hypothetical protein